MIRLSRTANGQIDDLVTHYARLERPEAVRNLRSVIARAAARIETQRGPFYPAPRPYPALTRHGWQWLHERPYWIGFTALPVGAVIQVVFHDTADIPGRL